MDYIDFDPTCSASAETSSKPKTKISNQNTTLLRQLMDWRTQRADQVSRSVLEQLLV